MLPHTIIDFTEPRQNLRLHHAREECATENCLKRGFTPDDGKAKEWISERAEML
jgi:hypothetical protein